MIKLAFTHSSDDGEKAEFENDARDTFVWESTDRDQRSFLSTFQDGMPRMVDLYRLAWITARRLELIPPGMKLDDYAGRYVVEVDMDESGDEPDPTSATASPGG